MRLPGRTSPDRVALALGSAPLAKPHGALWMTVGMTPTRVPAPLDRVEWRGVAPL
jgi:hypothetical protein